MRKNSSSEQNSPAEGDYLARVGARVRSARARRGMTRKILSGDSGVSERYLADLENGRGNISILLLRQIAVAMNMQIEDLVREAFPSRALRVDARRGRRVDPDFPDSTSLDEPLSSHPLEKGSHGRHGPPAPLGQRVGHVTRCCFAPVPKDT